MGRLRHGVVETLRPISRSYYSNPFMKAKNSSVQVCTQITWIETIYGTLTRVTIPSFLDFGFTGVELNCRHSPRAGRL